MTSASERRRPAAALLAAGLVMAGAMPPSCAALAEAPVAFRFEGVVEPMRRVIVASHLNGIVDEVLFTPGAVVQAGDPLFRIDPKEFEIAAAAARAAVQEARARLDLAADAAARQARLLDGGSGSRVLSLEAEVERRIAEAHLAAAEAALAAAELALDRTTINAPIAGRIGWPLVAPGAFVEAKAGTKMAEIVQTDPVLVAYRVPPETRVAALATVNAAGVEDMFLRMTVEVVLPGGASHPYPGRPRFDSATVDPATGTLTSWAEVPNPKGTLVPGLPVQVVSRLRAAVQ